MTNKRKRVWSLTLACSLSAGASAARLPLTNAGFAEPVLGEGWQNGGGYAGPGWGGFDEQYACAFDTGTRNTTSLATHVPVAPVGLTAAPFGPSAIDLVWSRGDQGGSKVRPVEGRSCSAALKSEGRRRVKSEGRRSKAERRPKPEGRRPKTEPRSTSGFGLRISALGLRASDFKDFGLQSSGLGFGMAQADFRAALRGDGAANGYRVERAFGSGAFTLFATLPTDATTYRDLFLPASSSCSYRLTAFNDLGNSSPATATATTAAGDAKALPGPAFANVRDYGFMWWSNGQASATYAIKTSRYGMSFNRTSLSPGALFPLANAGTESAVLTESAAASFPAAPPVSFSCQVITSGTRTNMVAGTSNSGDVQLVESGKFFQRRWQKVSVGSLLVATNQTGLEVAAWPDRISFVLRVVPQTPVVSGVIEMQFGLTNSYHTGLSSGAGGALQAADGSGFAFLKSTGSTTILIDPTKALVTVRTAISDWAANQEKSVGLVIYPAAAGTATVLDQAVATEPAPLSLTARSIVPAAGGALTAAYDADRGWHNITLPPGGTAGANGILRVSVAVTNHTANSRVVRLNFNGVPFYIPGITAVLRDGALNPVGIPVQLSKNWHRKTPAERFEGEWFHGLTMLTIPANTNLLFELAMVGQNWGGLPAATHSQLSVIGYYDGGNQQWDEAALGNYGESLCYDADHSLTDNDGTDSRPLLLLNSGGQTGRWCGNAGGAQFLRYYASGGSQRRHSRMRTQYVRYCPNLAEVVFAGQTDNGAMDFSYSAALYRSDDYTRGVHRLRMTVNSDLSFSRLVFFQQAADTYAYNNGTALAYGNATNLAPVRQWTATWGQNKNMGTPVALTGPMPWAMSWDAAADAGYAPANRGFVIRSWRSCLNGSSNVPPYLVERSIPGASLFDLVPPPGVTNLRAGDYLEAEIVRFYVPKYASNYYGPNDSFRRALTNYQNSYQLGLREAVGNNLKVTPQWGMLERLFPIQIQATNNRAEFTVTGGLGCVPVTFTGLSDYRAPVLEENVGGLWTPLNQAVAGSDFWQCDYNAASGAWEITFTLKLDGTNYLDINALLTAPPARTFRFRLGGAQPPRFSTIAPKTGQTVDWSGQHALTIGTTAAVPPELADWLGVAHLTGRRRRSNCPCVIARRSTSISYILALVPTVHHVCRAAGLAKAEDTWPPGYSTRRWRDMGSPYRPHMGKRMVEEGGTSDILSI
jgi:hypothetical protein